MVMAVLRKIPCHRGANDEITLNWAFLVGIGTPLLWSFRDSQLSRGTNYSLNAGKIEVAIIPPIGEEFALKFPPVKTITALN